MSRVSFATSNDRGAPLVNPPGFSNATGSNNDYNREPGAGYQYSVNYDAAQGQHHHSINGEPAKVDPSAPLLPYDAEAQMPGEGRSASKKDIALMVWINFLSFVCFAIVLPSLWPYLDSFGTSKSWVGWAVAVNSLGTFVASPILGKWADWRGAREAIFLSLIIMIAGNFLYAIAMDVWVLLLARFIVGCAAANYAPASAYLTYATSEKMRTAAMGLNSAAGILGFILGPAIASAIANIPKFSVWKAEINQFTSPGWASIILTLVALPFLITFNDIRPNKDPFIALPTERQASSKKKIMTNPIPTAGSMKSLQSFKALKEPGVPIVAVLVCLYLQFVFYTAFTVFETIGTPYTQEHYGWDVTKNGYLFAGIGAACILAIVILQGFSFFASDRTLLLGTQFLMLGGFAVLINYPFSEPVDLIRFLVGVFAASIGFSAACALLIALFSKLLEDQEMGLMMGYLSTAGSAARIVGPLGAGYILDFVGGSLVFLITVVLLLTALIVNVVFYRKLYTKGAADFVNAAGADGAQVVPPPEPLNKAQENKVEAERQRQRQKEEKRQRRWEERDKRKRMADTHGTASDVISNNTSGVHLDSVDDHVTD